MTRNFILLFSALSLFCINCINADVVTISGRQIFVNKSLYTIKGICYHPVPKDSNIVSFSSLTEDLALMKEAGINTIRVYSPIIEKAVLDEIARAGLKVIINYGYNQGRNF